MKLRDVATTILFFAVLSVVQPENNNIPFLYYYSTQSGAFIIERADGTDTRTLAEVGSLPDHHAIAGPGWSASGEWLAWYSTIPDSGGTRSSSAMLVEFEGGISFPVREDCNVNSMDWSPTADLLLVGCYLTSGGQLPYIYYVFDADRQEEILTFDASDFGLSGIITDITEVKWTPSGDYLVVYYADSVEIDETNYWMRVYLPDGSLIAERRFYTPHLRIYFQPYWSSSNHVLYLTSDGSEIHVENVENSTAFPLESPAQLIGWVDWSPSGDYALIYGGMLAEFIDDADNANPVWLLSIPDKSLTMLSGSARPLNVSRQAERFYLTTTWTPSNDIGFIVDTSNTVFVIIPETAEIVTIHEGNNSDREIYPQFVRWHGDGENLSIVEYSLRDFQGTFYTYYVRTQQLLTTLEAHVTFDNFSHSSTEQYFAYSSSDCDGVCMVDQTSGDTTQITFMYPPDRISTAMELLWHPQADWLIAAGDPDGVLRWLNVINADGTMN